MTQDSEAPLLEIHNLKKWFPIKGGLLSTVKSQVRAVDGKSISWETSCSTHAACAGARSG